MNLDTSARAAPRRRLEDPTASRTRRPADTPSPTDRSGPAAPAADNPTQPGGRRAMSGQRTIGARRPVAPRRPVDLVILIPAYQPTMRLPSLVEDLGRRLPGCQVLIVDDGSDADCARVFAAARDRGARVIGHDRNLGKGQALRTGVAHALKTWPGADVVCADADGQHTPSDIAAVARQVRNSGHMTLGVRRFTGPVPLRSRVGNSLTALLFRGATGWRLGDTQTGLRGYPAGRLEWLTQVPGSRYEYELSALLRAHELGLEVEEVEIATVYEPGNTSSHFHPLQDSARIYAPLLRFVGASLASFAIDWVGVMVLAALTGNLLVAAVGARLTSGTANFFMNRRVFKARPGTVGRTAVRYAALALTLLAASYLMLEALTGLGIALGVAKILGDASIYAASYAAQRTLVFRERAREAREVA